MDILKWFKKPTNYDTQAITEKQYQLITVLDELLTRHHTQTPTLEMQVYLQYIEIPLVVNVLPFVSIAKYIEKKVKMGEAYIPRSIAFFTGPDGSWNLVYALRDETLNSSNFTVKMWENMLGRTNDARSIYENTI
jgi:hypothetical protein